MKQKILFIMIVSFLTVFASAQTQRTLVAGEFRDAVHLDGDQRKVIKDENILFQDTVFVDLDLDGRIDRVIRGNGLQLILAEADGRERMIDLSKESGKVAVKDLNTDGLPDIIQQNGITGPIYYENSAIKALISEMIPISEDSKVYFAYNNYSKDSGITYYPSLDNKNIAFEIRDEGLYLVPAENWNGNATLTIAYGKDGLRDTVHCPIVVLAQNDAPVVSPHVDTLKVLEDHELVIFKDSLLAFVSDADPDDQLTIILLDDRSEVSEEEDRFLYRPSDDWNGTDDLFFLVSDGDAVDTLVQQITVIAVNDAPRWSKIADTEFPEDNLYRLPLTWFYDHASDVETPDSLLRFHVYSGEHVVISAEGGGITLVPDENWFGDDILTLMVRDIDGLEDTAYWAIRVTSVNDAPELSALPDTVFYEDGSIILDRSILEKFAYDVETPVSSLKWQVKKLGKIRAFYNGANIRCTASRNWFGTDSLQLTVSDGELTASRIWRVHVLPVNDAPVFIKRVPPRVFLEDDTLIIKKESLYELAHDAETRARDLKWTAIPSPDLTFYDNGDEYCFYAAPNWFGSTFIRLIINDGELSDTLDQSVKVLSVNDKPLMKDLPLKEWNEDDTLSLDRSYLESFASDIETPASDLMWTFINAPHVKIKNRLNAITITPDPDWNGKASIGMVIYDGGLRDTGYMDINIKAVNDAPRWKAFPDTSIDEDRSLVLPLDYVKQFVYDPDEGDKIDLKYKAGDNFYVDEQEDTLIIWPYEDWFGKETIEFTATDGKRSVSKKWTIPVNAVNDPPYFTMALPDSLSFDANSSDTILFEDVVYDVDNDLSDLTWDITPGRYVRYLIDDNINKAKKDKDKKGGIIFFTENYKSGEDAVTLRVSDGYDVILFYMPVFVHPVDRFLMSNPEKLELLPNTPNPFRTYTDIRYSLPVGAQISLKIYNLLGKEIAILVNKYQDAQNYSIRWYGETDAGMPAPSGVYLCRLVAVIESEPVVLMQKMMLVR